MWKKAQHYVPTGAKRRGFLFHLRAHVSLRLRVARIAIIGGAAIALVTALSAPASTKTMALVGTTGPEPIITLKKGGRAVRTLKRGTYRMSVNDRSLDHNFRLRGPGMDREITSVRFTGRRTVKVILRRGLYTYLCDPHEYGGMKVQFIVK